MPAENSASKQRAVSWRVQLVAVSVLLLMMWLQFYPPDSLRRTIERLEGIFYDLKVEYLPPWPRSVSNIQIVDIDERSLHQVGRMPWDRHHFADLTDKLTAAGAIVVVFDLLFSEPQANNALELAHRWQERQHLHPERFEQLLTVAQEFDADRRFAEAMGATEVVIANLLHHHPALQTGKLSEQMMPLPSEAPPLMKTFSGYAAPIPRLAEAAVGQGFMNAETEADGFVRKAALVNRFENALYPSLALEAFRAYSLVTVIEPLWVCQPEHCVLEGLRIGNQQIDTDAAGRINIPFRDGAGFYPYTSAADILNDKFNPEQFDQAVVFVGTSATGLADLRATPVSLNFPGVEIHATIFDALMMPQYLPYRPDWWQGAVAVTMLLAGIVCLWILPRLSPILSLVMALTMLLLVSGINIVAWRFYFIELPALMPVLLVLALSIYFTGHGFFSEAMRRRQIRGIFGQYLPQAHIERLLTDPKALSLAGEKRELSVLFSDIRGFTSISENMSAGELKSWLNRFFSPVTRAILQQDGTIDKYVGDMVMAFWGAPLEEHEHAGKAIRGAFSMLEALDALNQEFATENLPQADIGIGINTGEMNVGDMGSDFRRSYTVIGDAVNLGSRLEGLTKYYGVKILVSEFTRQQATEYDYMLVDKVRVKGKQHPVTLYMPVAPGDKQRQNYRQINQALQAYFDADFHAALAQLEALTPFSAMAKIINLYRQRTEEFILHPPEPGWDGAFTHSTK